MNLRPLLQPRSVAVVGANDRPGSYADTVFTNLERAGFEGPVYGVNPKRDTVHGHPCFPTVADLPEAVDAVVVAIPAPAVPPVITEIAERGCGGAVVFAAGFGEVETGRELERELRRIALDAGLPVCGPNGNGVVAVGSRAPLWGDSVPALLPGSVVDPLVWRTCWRTLSDAEIRDGSHRRRCPCSAGDHDRRLLHGAAGSGRPD